MKTDYLITEVKKHNFPRGEYAIFGSFVLAIRDIREAPNVDIIVTNKLWNTLTEKYIPDEEGFIRIGPLKISNWWFAPTRKSVDKMIQEAEFIDDLPFVRLEEVRSYKSQLKREKDIEDVNLIDSFMSSIGKKEPKILGLSTYTNVLDIFIKKIENEIPNTIISVILFGSITRNTAKGSSDIDLFAIYDDKKSTRNVVHEKLINIIIQIRQHPEYLKLTSKNIHPEIYPFLLSKKNASDLLWVSLDATFDGVIIKDTDSYAKKLFEQYKSKLKNQGARRIPLTNGKWCWVLYKDFSQVLQNQINI